MNFPCPTCTGSNFYKNNSHNSNLGRSSDYGNINVDTHGSTPEIGIDFQYQKNACFRRSTSFGHMVDVTADVDHMLYFVLAT